MYTKREQEELEAILNEMNQPRSGSECEHDFHFIQSSSAGGISQATLVVVCKHCGQFQVTAKVNGNLAEIHFWLSDKAAVEYAGKYRKILGLEKDETSIWNVLTKFQKHLLFNSQNKYGSSIGEWEPDKLREAEELVELGLITKSQGDSRSSTRHNVYHIKIKGRHLLKVMGED